MTRTAIAAACLAMTACGPLKVPASDQMVFGDLNFEKAFGGSGSATIR